MAGVGEKSRMEKRFELWDREGKGYVERSDVEAGAVRFAQALGEQGSAKEQALIDAYMRMWDSLSRAAGTDRVGKDVFLRLSETAVIGEGDGGFDRVLRPVVEALADLLDADGDGRVGEREFLRWAGVMGVRGPDSARAFEHLDGDGDGTLSREEFTVAVRDYLFGRHDAPLFGAR